MAIFLFIALYFVVRQSIKLGLAEQDRNECLKQATDSAEELLRLKVCYRKNILKLKEQAEQDKLDAGLQAMADASFREYCEQCDEDR